jgi:hypothetical protein
VDDGAVPVDDLVRDLLALADALEAPRRPVRRLLVERVALAAQQGEATGFGPSGSLTPSRRASAASLAR